MTDSSNPWWQTEIIYQVYPRSFQDTNGDGVGDLPGITERLSHIRDLGAGAVWISPFFKSPMHDFGYDVADYRDIDPLFGDLEDFDELLERAHELDLKVLLDLVPNHTSDEHEWFEASRRDRTNDKADWYIWSDPATDGGPPNNWISVFGGSAWEYVESRGQYYLHCFDVHQPDLNFRNPAVIEAILDVMRFWLDRGVDGFRVDVIEFMIKDEQLRDEPPNPHWNGVEPYRRLEHVYTRNQPEVHEIIKQMRRVSNEYDERVIIGEVFLFDASITQYYGDDDECHLPFNFRLIYRPWSAREFRDAIQSYEDALEEGQWPNWVLGNHDQHRVATRVGQAQARIANVLLMTLRGTPFLYYGEEIGMLDVPIPYAKARDPQAVNQPEVAEMLGRDPERTPMQWDASPNAGFCGADVEPWLPLAHDFRARNVALQQSDDRSMLALVRALIALRRNEDSLLRGSYADLPIGDAGTEVLAYTRESPDADAFLVLLNLTEHAQVLDASVAGAEGELVLTAQDVHELEEASRRRVRLDRIELPANDAWILRLIS